MKFYSGAEMPRDELWDDPVLKEAWFEERGRQYDAGAGLFDEDEDLSPPGLDPSVSLAGFEEFVAIEQSVRQSRSLTAEQDRFFQATLVRAATVPEAWVGADPTAGSVVGAAAGSDGDDCPGAAA